MGLGSRFAKFKNRSDHKNSKEKRDGFKFIKKIIEFFKSRKFLKRIFNVGSKISKSFDESDNEIRLPENMEKAISDTDWKTKDVLVGSVRNEEQYSHCIKRKYYYVPARFMTDGVRSIRFVAMALPKISDEPGIRYFGKVIRTSKVKRSLIPFPQGRNNADEKYYTFVVENWIKLDHPILPKNEPVYEPRSTNLFLLENCDSTYELFNVHSKEEFILLYKLKKLLSGITAEVSESDNAFFKINENFTVALRGDSIVLTDSSGNMIVDFPALDFQSNPKRIFKEICGLSGINAFKINLR